MFRVGISHKGHEFIKGGNVSIEVFSFHSEPLNLLFGVNVFSKIVIGDLICYFKGNLVAFTIISIPICNIVIHFVLPFIGLIFYILFLYIIEA